MVTSQNFFISVFTFSTILVTEVSLTPKKLTECDSCKVLVKSFQHWLKKTERGKFEGGDADWEENRLKTYSRSEIRLVDIQEGLCSELTKNQDDCYRLAEHAEQLIDQWWSGNHSVDMFSWLCTDTLSVCCPLGHYGPACDHCPSKCMKHSHCDGEGTRHGSGQCICSVDYEMVDGVCFSLKRCRAGLCNSRQYCNSAASKRECLPCSESCKTCSGPTNQNCTECADNHIRSITGSCINTHLPDEDQFPGILVYILPIVFVTLYFVSTYSKSRCLYFTVLIVIFIAVNLYLGFFPMLVELFWDFIEYYKLYSLWNFKLH